MLPGLKERVTAVDGRLEWDVLLARPPRGTGDLRIDARVEARAAPDRSRRAWRWPVGRGRFVDIGALVVRDAAGRKLYRALPGASSNDVSLTVPASVLEGAVYPVVIDPVISPEYPVSDPAPGPPPTYPQIVPSVAFGGSTYFVVWQDGRPTTSNYDIYGARVSQAGVVLDPNGIPISAHWYPESRPTVAFDGSNFLVAWEDLRSTSYDIYGSRVSQAGVVLDPNGIPISTTGNEQHAPRITFGGTNFFVAWQDSSGAENDVYGARVSPSGTVLDPAGIPISTGVGSQAAPSVASDGSNYLVAWQDGRSGTSQDVYGARVSQAGAVLDPTGIPISSEANDQSATSVAFDGSNYLVAWQDGRSGTSQDVYGARVSQAGAVLDPTGIPISAAANDESAPSVAFGGTNYLVAWQDTRSGSDVYGARVSPGGTVLDPNGIAVATAAGEQLAPSVTFDGTNYLVGWQDGRSAESSFDIYGARVSQAGAVLDPAGFLISTTPNVEVAPSVGFDGTNYLVAWEDDRSGTVNHDIYGARVEPGGDAARSQWDRDLHGREQPVRSEHRLRRHELPNRVE